MLRLFEFISFDPRSHKAILLENFKKDPPGLWLIIQNSILFSWLKNCLDQYHPDRKNIKSTSAIFAYINFQCKLFKDQELIAKETENMFTGSSADQQCKDASAARYPALSTLHQLPFLMSYHRPLLMIPTKILISSQALPMTTHFKMKLRTLLAHLMIIPPLLMTSTTAIVQSYTRMSLINHLMFSIVYPPDLTPSSLSSVSTPMLKLDKKMMPCFQHAKQNFPMKADECPYSHDRVIIKAYLDAQHAKLTGSKKAVHDKTKEIFKALNKSSSSCPSLILLVQIPLVKVLSNTPAISLHNSHDLAHHYDDFVVTDGVGHELELHERLERISGLNLLDSAINADCVVTSSLILQDGPKIPSRTLADTGCT
jgi:hypothetical protein